MFFCFSNSANLSFHVKIKKQHTKMHIANSNKSSLILKVNNFGKLGIEANYQIKIV